MMTIIFLQWYLYCYLCQSQAPARIHSKFSNGLKGSFVTFCDQTGGLSKFALVSTAWVSPKFDEWFVSIRDLEPPRFLFVFVGLWTYDLIWIPILMSRLIFSRSISSNMVIVLGTAPKTSKSAGASARWTFVRSAETQSSGMVPSIFQNSIEDSHSSNDQTTALVGVVTCNRTLLADLAEFVWS